MFKRILLLIDTRSRYGRAIVEGVAAYVKGSDNVMCEFHAWQRPDTEEPIEHYDGILAQVTTGQMTARLKNASVPVVNVHSGMEQLPDLPSVINDDHLVGSMAAADFLARGFRHFAFFALWDRVYSRHRFKGFQQHILESPRPRQSPQPPTLHVYRPTGNPTLMLKWLTDLPKPVAVLANNDYAARLLIEECRLREIRVPEDIAVIGVDNDELECTLIHPPLSSIAPANERIGYEAASLLDRMIQGQSPPPEPLRIPPRQLISRQSSDILAVEDPLVRHAVQYMRRHISDLRNIETLLDALPVSRRNLELRFRLALNRTPHEELRRMQLDHARTLLTETRLPITEIAFRSGFHNLSHFGVIFRREFHLSPSAFRRQIALH